VLCTPTITPTITSTNNEFGSHALSKKGKNGLTLFVIKNNYILAMVIKKLYVEVMSDNGFGDGFVVVRMAAYADLKNYDVVKHLIDLLSIREKIEIINGGVDNTPKIRFEQSPDSNKVIDEYFHRQLTYHMKNSMQLQNPR
jgi:hypothetical protein